jgi:hypothetical protein
VKLPGFGGQFIGDAMVLFLYRCPNTGLRVRDPVADTKETVGLSPGELLSVAAKGSHAADELPKLLRSLGVDPQKLTSEDPATMRDLQRICITCGHKGQCHHDLAAGTAARHYRDYCPNAISLDALFHEIEGIRRS